MTGRPCTTHGKRLLKGSELRGPAVGPGKSRSLASSEWAPAQHFMLGQIPPPPATSLNPADEEGTWVHARTSTELPHTHSPPAQAIWTLGLDKKQLHVTS